MRAPLSTIEASALRRRGLALEWATLGWNVVGLGVLVVLAVEASSVALVGFGLDSLIEIGASTVVIWELSGTGVERQRRALRIIGIAFVCLAAYLVTQSAVAIATHHHAAPSVGGIAWTAVTALVMFGLAFAKRRTGLALGNPVLVSEGSVTFIDGMLAVAVLLGLALNLLLGWWWADPVAGLVIVFYAVREAAHVLKPEAR
jgi:divalent metal cation (Fe/Co/Zn/Cd) transporter